ncbi:hypothetical protein SDC9_198502 [bioreactor metagenome]|uniref:Uncharacterized protein n=1 Tax=bioreactor metagenome TaxID=1076179 RepID=A0A645IJ45_9ZZZZ
MVNFYLENQIINKKINKNLLTLYININKNVKKVYKCKKNITKDKLTYIIEVRITLNI